MGTDLGHEFSDGHFVSDVLLRPASTTDFPCNFQKRNNTTIEKGACHGYALILRILMAGSYV